MRLAVVYEIELPPGMTREEQDALVEVAKRYVPDVIGNCLKTACAISGTVASLSKVIREDVRVIHN